jgi:hypothetical protein
LDSQYVSAFSWLPAVSLVAGLTLWAGLQAAHAAEPKPEPFKFMNIHFETNASGCDMGIQILFDTDGVTELSIEGPNDVIVFSSWTPAGKEDTHDQTEGFQERVEPPIRELENALGCDFSPDAISLSKLFRRWPAGTYEFEAASMDVDFEGETRLTHKIPAGPVITAPADGAVVPHDQPLSIRWNKVTGPILPYLGPVEIVGYHVLVKDVTVPGLSGPLPPAQLDIDVAKNETSAVVPKQFLEPNRIYEFEVLATEKGANQTITEGGVFCTRPKTPANCELP